MNNCKRFSFVVIGKPIIPILQRQTVIYRNLFTFIHWDDISGNPNTSIPIEWYIDVIQQIRDAVSETLPVYIFSDGSREELQDILALPGVQQVTFGTAIGDILAMSKARLFVASGSTFSRWVRYLGRMNTITYPGQLKQYLLEEDEPAFEIEAEQIPEEYLDRLKKQLQ